jgi:PST family polysaccharide transporter
MGGAALIGLFFGMVRTKFAAILIGVNGIGLLSSLVAIQGLVSAIAGLGIQTSVVRELADAFVRGDEREIGAITLTLRRISFLSGLFGAVVMVLVSPQISQLTFGAVDYQWDIAALSAVILLGNLQGGQVALIQAARKVNILAKMQIYTAFFGTIVAVIFYIFIGLRGIVPSLVMLSIIQLAISFYYTNQLVIPEIKMSWIESIRYSNRMVHLGLTMMWSSLLNYAVIYATNVAITSHINLQAVGIYSAALALSGVLVNFVLSAMAADYYPRLSGFASNKKAMANLVNHQTEVGLLLAVPGLMATLTLGPWILEFFYTSEFLSAVNLMQWFILGCLGRVISWPLAFIVLALGRGRLYLLTETATNLVSFILMVIGLLIFGIEGVAIGFFILYIIYTLIMYITAKYLIGFSWSRSVNRLLIILLPMIILDFILTRISNGWMAILFEITITFVVTLYCIRELLSRIWNIEDIKISTLRKYIPGYKK